MKPLSLSFYLQQDVVHIARSLLGKILHTQLDGHYTSGMIVETEAYNGIVDKASHAYGNRRTNRTEIMFAQGGVAYVYFCYGIHHLFNVVSNVEGVPHATLIRALEPLNGLDMMLERRRKLKVDHSITKGPGSVAQAMGLHTRHSGESLMGPAIWITEADEKINQKDIIASPRIGVDYAQEDALLPYRFYLANNPYVSGKKLKEIG
jgi:DNA-3-methyladenine glycosylase